MPDRKANDFLNGVPELLALRLLGRRPMHGYDLVQDIKLATGGRLSFGEGSVYPVLHRLEAEGAIVGARQNVNGRERVVYRLTPTGEQRLGASAENWARVAAAIALVLGAGNDAELA